MNSIHCPLPTEPHLQQRTRWPQEDRPILAHHDSDSVVVYQAYRPADARNPARWRGLNLLDFALMAVRDQLRESTA